MDVSIIIINYNTFEVTSRCIRHVIEKTKAVEYEIILVDNGSTEIDPHTFLNEFPQLTLIPNPENVGFAKGNNIGIGKAKGEFVLLLNSDAFLINDAIGLTLDFLKANSNIAVATGRLEYPDGKVQNNCQRFPSITGSVFELLRLQRVFRMAGAKVLLGSFFSYDEVINPDWVWGTFFMFRRSTLQQLQGHKLADDFFMYGEDMQWCMDFNNLGLKCVFIPEARIVHYLGKSGGKKEEWMKKNMNIFMEKNYSFFHRNIIRWLEKLL